MEVKFVCLITFLLITLYGVGNVKGVSEGATATAAYYTYYRSGNRRTCDTSSIAAPTGDTAAVATVRHIVHVVSDSSSTQVAPGRKRRSVEMVDESGRTYVNGDAEDNIKMFNRFDGNCDGYIDTTEWAKLAPLDQFIDLLNVSDVNGDCRLNLQELELTPLMIYPEDTFMMIPMSMYEEMKSAMENNQEGDGEEGKGRKEDSE